MVWEGLWQHRLWALWTQLLVLTNFREGQQGVIRGQSQSKLIHRLSRRMLLQLCDYFWATLFCLFRKSEQLSWLLLHSQRRWINTKVSLMQLCGFCHVSNWKKLDTWLLQNIPQSAQEREPRVSLKTNQSLLPQLYLLLSQRKWFHWFQLDCSQVHLVSNMDTNNRPLVEPSSWSRKIRHTEAHQRPTKHLQTLYSSCFFRLSLLDCWLYESVRDYQMLPLSLLYCLLY